METMEQHFNKEALTHDDTFIAKMGMIEFYDEIENQINQCKDRKSVLVIGCGTGLEIERIKFTCDVTAIDISPVMIEQLMKRNYYQEVRLHRVCMSILDYHFGSQEYDIVISCYTLHHFNEEQKAYILAHVYNDLKSCGIFINGDITAQNDDEEQSLVDEAYKIYNSRNLPFGSLHIDVPFTKEKEFSMLKAAGFHGVSIEKEWANTTLFRCTR